jgi:Homeodomain-like domain
MSDQLPETSEPLALSPLQIRVVTALAEGMSISDAAAFVGIHRATVHRWLQDPAFYAALKKTRHEFVTMVNHEFQTLTGVAVIKLRMLLESPKTPPAVVAQVSLALLNRRHFPKPDWEMAAIPDELGSDEAGDETKEDGDATLKAGVASVAICRNLSQAGN